MPLYELVKVLPAGNIRFRGNDVRRDGYVIGAQACFN